MPVISFGKDIGEWTNLPGFKNREGLRLDKIRKMKYKLINNAQQKTYAIIMDSDDEEMGQLIALAKRERVSASQFMTIGAFSETVTGFFDFFIKDYQKTTFKEQMEVLALNGDIYV